MTTLLTPPPPAPAPRPYRWTVKQFHALGDQGLFRGRRAKLIRGQLLEEGPMNPPHAMAGELAEEALRLVVGAGWRVRVDKPLVFNLDTDPMPDIAIVRGQVRGNTDHPTSAELVVEIADTTLDADITEMAELYATAGIADYWVVDVAGRRLLVFRDPVPLPAGLGATAYRTHLTLTETESVSQPRPLSGGETAVATQTDITTRQDGGQLSIVGGPSLERLVDGLNRLGVKPPGIIAVLQAIKTAGALQADLVVQ